MPAFDPFFWAFIATLVAMTLVIVIIMVKWVIPARNTIAQDFIKASRQNKHVVLMDDGQNFEVYLCDKQSGYYRTEDGEIIFETPKSERMTDGGVQVSIGESNTMQTINTQIADVINKVVKTGISMGELRKAVQKIEEARYGVDDESAKKKT